jgi:hypothetical protein
MSLLVSEKICKFEIENLVNQISSKISCVKQVTIDIFDSQETFERSLTDFTNEGLLVKISHLGIEWNDKKVAQENENNA